VTLEDFTEAHSDAPYDDSELAELCQSELDQGTDLHWAAHKFLEAQENFYAELDAAGVTRG
jgi:hypothetical protein